MADNKPESRQKRETGSDIKYYLGFKLDGVNRYANLSQTLSGEVTLAVYLDPDVRKFTDDPFSFKPFWPFNDRNLIVQASIISVLLCVCY